MANFDTNLMTLGARQPGLDSIGNCFLTSDLISMLNNNKQLINAENLIIV